MRNLVVSVQFYLLILYIAAARTGSTEDDNAKRSKLSSIYALTPSLRVGRRSDGPWGGPARPPVELYRHRYPLDAQGRGGAAWAPEEELATSKRTGSGNTGMWFGPRLGRAQKRSGSPIGGSDYSPWAYIVLNGEGPVPRNVKYTPRLGRESEEEQENQDLSVLLS